MIRLDDKMKAYMLKIHQKHIVLNVDEITS